MRNDFGTRPYKSRFPYKSGRVGAKRGGAKKQGYDDKEDESIAMRVKKKRTKKELVASRDESYGKWGRRAKDWKKG